MSTNKSEPATGGKLYLAIYNALQCAGWMRCLIVVLMYFAKNKGYTGVWSTVETPISIFQTAAFLEVVHCLVGLVRSNWFLTLMQLLSRVYVLWGIIVPIKEVQNQFGIPMLLVAWCIAEITRYAYYALSLYDACPRFLVWCRYSFFMVLYPIGVSGELISTIAALPYIKERKLFHVLLPNKWNFEFNFYLCTILFLAGYLPFFPQLFGHMLKQRSKILGTEASKKAL